MEVLTMYWKPKWLVERRIDPDKLFDVLEAIGRDRRPIGLLVSPARGEALLRMPITIRSINVQLREGENDSLYYTMRVVEWRNARLRRRGERRHFPLTHVLKAEDMRMDDTIEKYQPLLAAELRGDDWHTLRPMLRHFRTIERTHAWGEADRSPVTTGRKPLQPGNAGSGGGREAARPLPARARVARVRAWVLPRREHPGGSLGS